MKKLERRYIEKYGYEFPLTGRVICSSSVHYCEDRFHIHMILLTPFKTGQVNGWFLSFFRGKKDGSLGETK